MAVNLKRLFFLTAHQINIELRHARMLQQGLLRAAIES